MHYSLIHHYLLTIKEITNNHIIVEHKATSLTEIKSIITKNKDKNKHTIIFIDHIGLIKNMNKNSIYEQKLRKVF